MLSTDTNTLRPAEKAARAARLALALMPIVLVAFPALAAESEGINELRPALPADFDVAAGVAVTSDYVFRGITQTDNDPALQGYLEASYALLYAGIWASNVEFAGTDGIESDLSFGLRPTIGDLALDFGYVHYVYTNDVAPNYGEIYGKAEYAIKDLTVGTSAFFSPDYLSLGATSFYLEGRASYSLPHNFAVSGAIGFQSFADELGLADYLTWNAGVSWTWKDVVTLDLRYHDTDLGDEKCTLNSGVDYACGESAVLTISVNSSLKQLTASE